MSEINTHHLKNLCWGGEIGSRFSGAVLPPHWSLPRKSKRLRTFVDSIKSCLKQNPNQKSPQNLDKFMSSCGYPVNFFGKYGSGLQKFWDSHGGLPLLSLLPLPWRIVRPENRFIIVSCTRSLQSSSNFLG